MLATNKECVILGRNKMAIVTLDPLPHPPHTFLLTF
jgi:hypothetical protein